MIACADSELAESEIERFREVIKVSKSCKGMDIAQIEREFLELTETILESFEKGQKVAIEAIKKVKNDSRIVEHVVSAAQIAMVADGSLRESEEIVLRDICLALGLDPHEY